MKSGTDHCPVRSLDSLASSAFGYIRGKTEQLGIAELVKLDHGYLYEGPPERQLTAGGATWERQELGAITWKPGHYGTGVRTGAPYRATQFHADLEVRGRELHLDYFKFVGWGPLCGVEGFLVSRQGESLAMGGHFGMPPAGGKRNWPLGLMIGGDLLTIYQPFHPTDGNFSSDGIALWRRG